MTIRSKLLIVIPLLILLANGVYFFLFRSAAVVQSSYDRMMDRVLGYRQSVQSAELSLEALYGYLLNPDSATKAEFASARAELDQGREALERGERPAAVASSAAGFIQLLRTLAEQEDEALSAAESPSDALMRYESAEKTVGFVREAGEALVELELSVDKPVFRSIQEENARMNRLGIAILAVQTLLGVALAYWISRSVTVPVERLVKAAKHVSEGKPQEALPALPSSDSKDELGVLTGAFLQMLDDLKASAERDRERLEQDRLVKELELRALQSQIHPHFLFNSLNVLSKLALIEGAEQTSDLIVSMSKMIRYVLRNPDEPVTLREELGHVADYVAIQQARFRSRVRFVTEADEAALSARIPSLTIQPLVENAFVHGIERLEGGGEIRLTVETDGSDAIVSVSDNGVGMDEATIRSLLRMEYEENAAPDRMPAGLGTRNVFRRLQLFGGRDDAVRISSRPGAGTTVTVRIPMNKEVEKSDVSLVDRG